MNKILLTLALVADIALVVNVYRHWDDPPPPEINIQINCQTHRGHTVCLAHNPIKEKL